MKTFHHEKLTGHTAVIFEGTPAMFYDGLRCFWKLKIAGKRPISSQRVAGPYDEMEAPVRDVLYDSEYPVGAWLHDTGDGITGREGRGTATMTTLRPPLSKKNCFL